MESEDKKWRRRSQARPGELSAAAFQLFSEQGFAATRLEDVAARAGVSKGTIYRYFDNKEALFAQVVNDAISPRFAEADVLLSAFEGSTPDLLRTFFKVIRSGLDGPFPPMIKLVISESGNFPELAQMWSELVVKRIFGLVHRIITRGMERNEFREVNRALIAPLVGAPVLLLAMAKQTFKAEDMQLDADQILSLHIDMLLRGLRNQEEGKET